MPAKGTKMSAVGRANLSAAMKGNDNAKKGRISIHYKVLDKAAAKAAKASAQGVVQR